MKLKPIHFILSLILTALFVSCIGSNDTDDKEVAGIPDFVALTFTKNDSVPGLENAVFTLEFDSELNDSIIVNLDSLAYKTRIDSVVPNFYFKSSSSALLYQEKAEGGLDTIYLTGKDTIDFSRKTKLQNTSSDGDSTRIYHIKVNVHQVEGELYIWDKIKSNIVSQAESNQKAVLFGNKYFYYMSTGNSNYLYTTTTPEADWAETAMEVVPANATMLNLRYMTEHNSQLYVTDNSGNIYYSENGINWQQRNYTSTKKLFSLLFSLNNKLWAIMESGGAYYIESSTDGSVWTDNNQTIDDSFPVTEYAALVFKTKVGKPKAIITGGYNKDGKLKQTNWSTENGTYWVSYRDNILGSTEGAALAQYDDKLFIFGAQTVDNEYIPIMESSNQGLNWNLPDSTYNYLPIEFEKRSYQSVFVNMEDDQKRIYLIGGKTTGEIYSDVWTGRLNRMFFDRQ
ncbi:hypothetical protein D0T49_10000 [Paludibacter sp. 221]|uniref:DUF6242 domain-containing protein n=1 Tax=Paludibacter sp. 221 TaxID=2302939 RepID=UPI0013D2D586|nr:DUF6242 domain-containing protein [Paludibacter sp. 221]NDV47377.1 hypothetical protein [Paludibacter sp. 221]